MGVVQLRKRVLCIIALCYVPFWAGLLLADNFDAGLTIQSANLANPPGSRVIVPVLVVNGTNDWADVFTTGSPILTETVSPGTTPIFPLPAYVYCGNGCIGEDLELADFGAIPPQSVVVGIADEFNWALNAPVGHTLFGTLDGNWDLATAEFGPTIESGTFNIGFMAEVGPLSPAPEPSTWALLGSGLIGLALFIRARRTAGKVSPRSIRPIGSGASDEGLRLARCNCPQQDLLGDTQSYNHKTSLTFAGREIFRRN
jgi:PEP-CTERM motif